MAPLTLGFLGLGLIGGSIAKGIKRTNPEHQIIAMNRTKSVLKKAHEAGIVDTVAGRPDQTFQKCDVIFLCMPVSLNVTYLEEIKPYLKPGCIVTDVGSTKSDIMEAARDLGLSSSFIGGHPMAGSERTGYEFSSDHLIENAYYVLTPSEETTKEQLEIMIGLVKILNAIPLVMDAKKHDRIVATVSHLPHIIASSLVNLVEEQDTPDQLMKQIAAGGFKDITRIASSSPTMWQQICLTNEESIEDILDLYIENLMSIKRSIKKMDEQVLYDFFDRSREYRNAIPDQAMGPLKKEYSLYCDIRDEFGSIASVTAILAEFKINIKNIGIIYNREFEQGVLKVEFYTEDSLETAIETLICHHHIVYRR